MNIGCEVSLVAYSGRSARKSVSESFITGSVVKVTDRYIWVRNYADGSIWKAIRGSL
jgi:hypothetical protein